LRQDVDDNFGPAILRSHRWNGNKARILILKRSDRREPIALMAL